jgi:hypothetical protein
MAGDSRGRLVRPVHDAGGAALMNLHTTIPLDEVPAIAAGDDAIARVLAEARLGTEAELLDAIESRRAQVGISNAVLDQLCGFAVGYASKCLSPARSKRPTTPTLFAMLDALALSVVLVIDPTKAARISPSWKPRDASHVRDRALSAKALERARPVVLAELARKASRPRWAETSAREFMQAMVEAP